MWTDFESLGGTGGVGPVLRTAAEQAIWDDPTITHLWHVRDRCDSDVGKSWFDRKRGVPLEFYNPAALVAPAFQPLKIDPAIDGKPSLRGMPPSTPDPGTLLMTPAGVVVIPTTGDFTIWFFGKNGGSALSTGWCIPGAGGNGLLLRHRTGDLIQIAVVPAAATSGTVVHTATEAVGDFDYVEFGLRRSDMLSSMYVENGPVGASATLTWVQQSSRLAVFAHVDLSLGSPQLTSPRGEEAVMIAVSTQSVLGSGSTAVRQRLRALMAQDYPSHTLA